MLLPILGRLEAFVAEIAGSWTVVADAVRLSSPSAIPNCETCPTLRITLLLCSVKEMASSNDRSHQSSNSGSSTVRGSIAIVASGISAVSTSG